MPGFQGAIRVGKLKGIRRERLQWRKFNFGVGGGREIREGGCGEDAKKRGLW